MDHPRKSGRFIPLTDYCVAGLHRWIPENICINSVDGEKACRQCRENHRLDRFFAKNKRRVKTPDETGVCRAGLHPWNDDNIITDPKTGWRRCRPCRRERSRRYDREHPNRIMCIATNCNKHTFRQSGENYICPKHRKNPPIWLAGRIARREVRIVGTEVLAA